MIAALADYRGRVTCTVRRHADSAALLVYAAGDARIAGADATSAFHKLAAEKVPASRLTAAELRRVADELARSTHRSPRFSRPGAAHRPPKFHDSNNRRQF